MHAYHPFRHCTRCDALLYLGTSDLCILCTVKAREDDEAKLQEEAEADWDMQQAFIRLKEVIDAGLLSDWRLLRPTHATLMLAPAGTHCEGGWRTEAVAILTRYNVLWPAGEGDDDARA